MKWATPFGSNVIVKLVDIPGSDMTAGGILTIQRNNDHEPKQLGEVVAVGPAVKTVAVGEHVLFSKFEGIETPAVTEDEYLCIGEHLLYMKVDLNEIVEARKAAHAKRTAEEDAAAASLAAARSAIIQAR